jgi:hypothetical protein
MGSEGQALSDWTRRAIEEDPTEYLRDHWPAASAWLVVVGLVSAGTALRVTLRLPQPRAPLSDPSARKHF